MHLVDHEWLDGRDSRTFEILNPMYRDRIDIKVDLAEARMWKKKASNEMGRGLD